MSAIFKNSPFVLDEKGRVFLPASAAAAATPKLPKYTGPVQIHRNNSAQQARARARAQAALHLKVRVI